MSTDPSLAVRPAGPAEPAHARRHPRRCFWDLHAGRWRCPPPGPAIPAPRSGDRALDDGC